MSAGVIVAVVGVLAGVIAVGLSGAFMTSTEFATTQRSCNPSLITNPAAQTAAEANCEDERVTVDGEACQVANLGLFSASFTPQCTYGTAYEINTALAPQDDVDPLELVPLFAAQNSFGSLGAALGGLEFEDCDSFFSTDGTESGAVLSGTQTIGTAAAAVALNGTLAAAAAGIKQTFDTVLEGRVDELEQLLFTDAHINLVEGPLNLALAGLGIPFTFDGTTVVSDVITADDVITDLQSLAAAAAAVNNTAGEDLFDGVADSLVNFAFAGPNVRDILQTAVSFGTEFFPGPITGFPVNGSWSAFNSAFLCDPLGGVCTAIEYLRVVNASLVALGDDRAGDIQLALGVFDSFASVIGGEAAAVIAAAAGAEGVKLDSVVTQVLAGAFTATGLADLFVEGIPTSPIPDTVDGELGSINQAYGIVCGIAGSTSCLAEDYFEALALISASGGDTDTAESLTLLGSMAQHCRLLGGGVGFQSCSTGISFSILSPFWAATTNTILGSFYDTESYGGVAGLAGNIEAASEDLIAQCKDGNQNGEAIALNQMTVPAGTAILAIGTIITAINLVVRGEKVKIIGVVGGVIALIGGIIALAGLLILQGTPIYSSISDPAPEVTPDDTNAFSLGDGFLFALGFIGAGLIGGLACIAGALCLSPKADTSTEILGKA